MIVFFKMCSWLRYRSTGGFIPGRQKLFSFQRWNIGWPGNVLQNVKTKKLYSVAIVLVCVAALASLVHPFGHVKAEASSGPLLPETSVDPSVMKIISRSCQNCHSEKTEWPALSYVAPLSWVLEKDVHDARSHMNLSQWNRYSPEERRQILSEIGSLVRNHRMPPARYTSLHPEARLSDYDAELLYQWTRTQRSRLH
jgi:uncharacterized membrane protein